MIQPKAKSRKPAVRILLKERAYEELKELIQSGIFLPHVSLSERQLAERLHMSKTPIRAALENLEKQGLVVVSPQRGIFVRELSARETNELFEMRLAIEPYIARQLAKVAWTAKQREQLDANLGQQLAAAKIGDMPEATKLDIAFHRMLASVLDNREFSHSLERCFDKLFRSLLEINRSVPGRLLKSQRDHVAIVSAIRKGNAATAANSMVEHLNYGRQFLLGGQ
jgi:DNA-binding GntR family transcriptional regulator